MSNALRLLQLSDVHFGARLTGGQLGLSEQTARQREEERRGLFARALALVEDRDLDGVLVPGDLFDDESIDSDTLSFVIHHFGQLAPRPVFIAPGNHDPYGGTSPYEQRPEENARGMRWPANVQLFAHEEFRCVRWPGRAEIVVCGCGVAANVPSDERRLAARIEREDARRSILLFHGSRDDGAWLQSRKATHPFSRDELLAQGFDWTALGHYHGHQVLLDDQQRPRAAYSGALLAGGLDELGAKGCLVVQIHPDHTEVEHVVLDPRQVHRVSCDLSGCEFHEEARGRMEEALRRDGAGPEDLVLLQLEGRRAAGLSLDFLTGLSESFFHLRVDSSRLRPDLELESYPSLEEASTTEERFVARLKELLDGEDPREGDTARRALLYGLDALHRGRLDTRYEDPGPGGVAA